MPINPHDLQDLLRGDRRGLLPTLTRLALLPASWLYGMGVGWRNRRYDQQPERAKNCGLPVISVGNITTGGTGKTPMVEWAAKQLRAKQLRVALISRGYGADQGARNDEAMELEERLPDVPHLQNPDRLEAAEIAREELESQLILLDDAFQHRRIQRDLDIVLIDALNPFGYGHLLPRGLLREHLSGLRRADVVVLSRADQVSPDTRKDLQRRIRSFAPDAIWAECGHRPQRLQNASGKTAPIEKLSQWRFGAFCGIGNPHAFQKTLQEFSADDFPFRMFADHHGYDRSDIDELGSWAASEELNCLLCTHKDLVKVGADSIADMPLWALMVGLEFLAGEEELTAKLDEIAQTAISRETSE